MSQTTRRRSRKRIALASVPVRLIRFPFDILFLTLDVLRVVAWGLWQSARRLRKGGHVRPFSPCVTGPTETTVHGEVRRCRMISKYGNPFVFRWLFPAISRVRSVENKTFFSWGSVKYRRPVPVGRLLLVGLFLCMFWGLVGTTLLFVLQPHRLRQVARRVRMQPEVTDGGADRALYDPDLARQLVQDADALLADGDRAGALERYEEAVRTDQRLLAAQVGLGQVALSMEEPRLDLAREAFRTALSIDRGDVRALVGMARVRLADGAPMQAVETLDKVLDSTPEHDQALLLRARAYHGAERHEQARKDVDRFLRGDADDPEAWLLKGRIENTLGDLEAAETAYRKAADDAGTATDAAIGLARLALAEGRHDEAEAALQELLQEHPDREDVVLLLTDVWRASGKNAKADDLLEAAAADHPGFTRVRERLVAAYVGTGRYNQGHKEAAALLLDDPGNLNAHLQLARIFLNIGLPAESVKHCRVVVAQNMAGSDGLLLLAQALLGDRQFRAAEREFRRLLSVSQRDLAAWVGLGRCALMAGDEEAAEDAFLKAASLSPDSAVPYLGLTELALGQKDLTGALEFSRKAWEADKENPTAMNNYAALLSMTDGDLQEALRLAKLAFGMVPDTPAFSDTLGWVYVCLGKPEVALPYLAYARRRMPRSPDTLYHFAEALYRVGRYEQSRNHVVLALDLSDDFIEAGKAEELLKKLTDKVGEGSK